VNGFQTFWSGLDWSVLRDMLISVIPALVCITLHELAHGFVAYLMGDTTAKDAGRLTLNPIKHIDIMGLIMMIVFRFGWAKPVPVNSSNFRNRRAGIVTVSLAGPLSNFVTGLICCILFYMISFFTQGESALSRFALTILIQSVYMNVGLMIFNLIPIPPLDGSKILLEFLPYRWQYKIYAYERYFGLILILLVYAGSMTPVLSFFQSYVLMFYEFISSLILNLFI